MSAEALDRFLRELGALTQVRRLYPAGHEQVRRATERAGQSLAAWGRAVRVTLLGGTVIVEDRSLEERAPAVQTLVRVLRRKGWETLRIDADAGAAGLLAWAGAAVTEGLAPYRAGGVAAGELAEEVDPEAPHVPTGAARVAADFFSLLPQTEEALSEVAARREQGLGRAREIVSSIAAQLTVGRDLFQPIRELKGHDDYTFTHALNVCVLSSALARSVGAPADLADLVALGALCHDLGKQKVPDEVLNKRGPLDEQERRTMNSHPADGARILATIGAAPPLLAVVAYQHHMGANGAGYPKPLPGDRPHPAARLVAVADVFDAMRTVRPYRPAGGLGEACTVLLQDRAAGKLHEPYVAAFFRLLGVLEPGARVLLSDGRLATVLEPGGPNSLAPRVEPDGGGELDLAVPGAPTLAALPEPVPEPPRPAG